MMWVFDDGCLDTASEVEWERMVVKPLEYSSIVLALQHIMLLS